jgi:ABC-type polysaccharide/polyol phosphate export permease
MLLQTQTERKPGDKTMVVFCCLFVCFCLFVCLFVVVVVVCFIGFVSDEKNNNVLLFAVPLFCLFVCCRCLKQLDFLILTYR